MQHAKNMVDDKKSVEAKLRNGDWSLAYGEKFWPKE